jgi:hypothetical protein
VSSRSKAAPENGKKMGRQLTRKGHGPSLPNLEGIAKEIQRTQCFSV